MSKDFNRERSNGIAAGREDSRWKDERIAELEARERELVGFIEAKMHHLPVADQHAASLLAKIDEVPT